MSTTQLTLRSSDGVEMTVDRDVACRSVLIKNMLEDLFSESDTGGPTEAVPIPNVNEAVLKKVGRYPISVFPILC